MTLLRLRSARADVSAREWGRLAAMFGFILAINVLGWGIYVLYVMPHHFDYRGEGGSKGLGVGLGVAITAWFLGFRHDMWLPVMSSTSRPPHGVPEPSVPRRSPAATRKRPICVVA